MLQQNSRKAAAASNSGIVSGKNAAKANDNQNGNEEPRNFFLKAIYKFETAFADGITADTLFDARTEKIIGCQADRLVCTGLFPQHEREDLQQILRLALLHEMSNFVSGGDRYVFAANVAANYGKNLIAKRVKEREATGGEVLSLNELLPDGTTREDHIAGDECGPESMKGKVKEFLESLPEVDRKICDELMDGRSIRDMMKDTALELGMSFSGIRYHITGIIRPAAVRAGLGEYFGLGGDAE